MADHPADPEEFELERAYDRGDLAAVFREFAAAFQGNRPISMRSDERAVRITVPDRVLAEFEVEYDADEEPPVAELELELEWDDPDGSSVRIDDRAADESAGEAGSERSGTEAGTADASEDPAAAAMPLEAVTRRDEGGEEATEPSTVEVTAATGDGESDAADAEAGGRSSRFEVYEDAAGEWRWRLVHWNGNIIADSGEGYTSRSNAERAVRSVMRNAPTAQIERRDRG